MGNEKGRSERRRVVLDLEVGAEPITGTIANDSGPAQPFSGLMQLVAALDGMRGRTATGGDVPTDDEPGLGREAQ